MRRRSAQSLKAGKKKSCGNARAVERMESQKQASHSFHEPLGNLANSGRASHISTAPATTADGNVQNQKQVFHVPTATDPLSPKTKNRAAERASPSAQRRALRAPPKS